MIEVKKVEDIGKKLMEEVERKYPDTPKEIRVFYNAGILDLIDLYRILESNEN